jgi:predicted Zn-dependent protease
MKSGRVSGGALAPLLCLILSCTTNPATGASEFSLVSESQEIAMGREAAAQVPLATPFYPDSAVQGYVARLGAKLAASGERPNLPWEFHVVDDPGVNAFALPGGFIFVTRGLMTDLNSEAELASVVGHEIGHVTARHSARQITREQLAQVGLVAGSIASRTFSQYAAEAQQGLQLLFLKYSRGDESQADMLGFRYALRTGYDVRAMREVFITLDGVTRAAGGSRVPEWQSTHPAPANRIEATDARLAQTKVNFDSLYVGRDRYLGIIDGMVYGENPRDGYFAGPVFYHPDLKFQFTFPDGWQTANQASGVAAVSSAQDAMVEVSLAQGSPDSVARAVFSGEGVSSSGVTREQIGGQPAVSGEFQKQGQQAVIRGRATFLSYGGRTYALVGYTSADRWGQYQNTIRSALASFRSVSDPNVLNVQPKRLKLEKLARAMTLAEWQKSAPSTVSLAELSLINRVDSTETLAAGRIVKRVVGGTGH